MTLTPVRHGVKELDGTLRFTPPFTWLPQPEALAKAGEPEASSIEARLLADPDVLLVGAWEDANWKSMWGVSNFGGESRTAIADYGLTGGHGKQLRAVNPANTRDGFGFHAEFPATNLPFGPLEEAYFRYRVYFPAGFAWTGQSGQAVGSIKLPGLAGKIGAAKSKVSAGGLRYNGDNLIQLSQGHSINDMDGFSVRMLTKGAKTLLPYAYLPDPNRLGTASSSSYFGWSGGTVKTVVGGGTSATFTDPGWNTIEQRIVMNTPGVADGIFEVWLNGVKGLSLTNVVFRSSSRPTLGISQVYWSYFYGGGTSDAPTSDSYIYFDDPVISTAYIGPRAD
jgi:hypothetical protein